MITMIKNKRGQESPLKNLFVMFLLVAAVGFAMFSFINEGLVAEYDTPELDNEAQFTVFQNSTGEVTGELEKIRSTLASGDSSTSDIIQVMVGRGFSALTTLLTAPFKIANGIIGIAFEAIGLPNELKNIASFGILVIVLFGIIALIMKVRA